MESALINLNDRGVRVIYNLEENMQIRSFLIIKGPVVGDESSEVKV